MITDNFKKKINELNIKRATAKENKERAEKQIIDFEDVAYNEIKRLMQERYPQGGMVSLQGYGGVTIVIEYREIDDNYYELVITKAD